MKFTPQAAILTTASLLLGSGTGSSTSSNTSGPPVRRIWMAFMANVLPAIIAGIDSPGTGRIRGCRIPHALTHSTKRSDRNRQELERAIFDGASGRWPGSQRPVRPISLGLGRRRRRLFGRVRLFADQTLLQLLELLLLLGSQFGGDPGTKLLAHFAAELTAEQQEKFKKLQESLIGS